MGLRLPGLRVQLPPSEPFVRNDEFADNNECMEVSIPENCKGKDS